MGRFTVEQILQKIVDVGGSEHLNLSGKDLSGLDLSIQNMQKLFVQEVWGKKDQQKEGRPWNSWTDYHLWYSGNRRAEAARKRARDRGTTAEGYSEAERIPIKGGILLMGANLSGVDFTSTNLQGADLEGANLSRALLFKADLSGARLWDVDLSHARLGRATIGELCRSPDEAIEKVLAKVPEEPLPPLVQQAALQNAILEWADFSGARMENVLLYHAKLASTRLELSQLSVRVGERHLSRRVQEEVDGRWRNAQIAYACLRKNFLEIGSYQDAADVYYRERLMEERTYWPTQAGTAFVKTKRREFDGRISKLQGSSRSQLDRVLKEIGLIIRRWAFTSERVNLYYLCWFIPFTHKPDNTRVSRLRWLALWLSGRFTGYWENGWRVGILVALFVTLFGFIYHFCGLIIERPDIAIASDVPAHGTKPSLGEALVYSLRTFTTLAFGSIEPSGMPGKLLAGVEAMMGPAFLALLVFVLSKKLRGY